MTPEIKQRIQQIRQGKVPKGYKKTKEGIIPNEWNMCTGNSIFSYIRNGFVGTVTPYYVSEGHKYVQGNNIKNGKIISTNLMYVNDEFYNKYTNSILKENDIVVVQSGDIGACAVVNKEYDKANCHALIIMTPYKTIDSEYIAYLLNSNIGKQMIE